MDEEYSSALMIDPAPELELDSAYLYSNISSIVLDAGLANATYLWSTGEVSQSIEVRQIGTYTIHVTIAGYWFFDYIGLRSIISPNLDDILVQCETGNNGIGIPYSNATAYLREDGTNTQLIEVTDSGLYSFIIIDECGCEHSGIIAAEIEVSKPLVFVPNSYILDGDGIKDQFRVVADELAEYDFQLLDPWGTVVFESNDIKEPWIGGVQDGESYYVQNGIYTVSLEYRSLCSIEKSKNMVP